MCSRQKVCKLDTMQRRDKTTVKRHFIWSKIINSIIIIVIMYELTYPPSSIERYSLSISLLVNSSSILSISLLPSCLWAIYDKEVRSYSHMYKKKTTEAQYLYTHKRGTVNKPLTLLCYLYCIYMKSPWIFWLVIAIYPTAKLFSPTEVHKLTFQ